MNTNKQIQHQQHWTERNTDDFVQRIAFDFAAQIEELLEQGNTSQIELAKAMNLTEGRVSQLLNHPGNIGLKSAVKLARAIRRKVALVLYDDNDPENRNGPVASGIFLTCWERAGRPTDVYALQSRSFAISVNISISIMVGGPVLDSTALFSSGPQVVSSGILRPENVGVPLLWTSQFNELTSTFGTQLLLPDMIPLAAEIVSTTEASAPRLLQ